MNMECKMSLLRYGLVLSYLLGGHFPLVAQTSVPVEFDYQINGTVPASQVYSVTSQSGQAVPVTLLTDGARWLSAMLSSNTTPAILTLGVNLGSLAVGTYSSIVTVSSGGSCTTGCTIIWTVTLKVTPAPIPVGALVASPASLSFTSGDGSAPFPQTLSITSTGGAITYMVTATSNSGWLTVIGSAPVMSPGTIGAWSGSTPAMVSVFISPSGLAVGTYSGTVVFTSSAANNSPLAVPVTLKVTQPSFQVSPSTLQLIGQSGGQVLSQVVTVSGLSSSVPIYFTATTSASWLAVSSASGMTPATLTVAANPASLSAGPTMEQ